MVTFAHIVHSCTWKCISCPVTTPVAPVDEEDVEAQGGLGGVGDFPGFQPGGRTTRGTCARGSTPRSSRRRLAYAGGSGATWTWTYGRAQQKSKYRHTHTQVYKHGSTTNVHKCMQSQSKKHRSTQNEWKNTSASYKDVHDFVCGPGDPSQDELVEHQAACQQYSTEGTCGCRSASRGDRTRLHRRLRRELMNRVPESTGSSRRYRRTSQHCTWPTSCAPTRPARLSAYCRSTHCKHRSTPFWPISGSGRGWN